MEKFHYIPAFLAALAFFFLPAAAPAHATQMHGAPEGLYLHQFSHLFFIFAMGILVYWLRSRALVKEPGWRYLQYACLFFLLWSLDAFVIHLLDEQAQWVGVTHLDAWRLRLDAPAGAQWLAFVYFLLKLDHLLCVPGMVFLFMGLRHLSRRPEVQYGRPPEKGAGS